MNRLTTLSNQAKQTIAVTLDTGDTVTLDLAFLASIQRWTVGVTCKNKTVANLFIVAHANLLRIWRNIFPFGLACNTLTGVDPSRLDDFSTGRAWLTVLSADEVKLVEQGVMGAP